MLYFVHRRTQLRDIEQIFGADNVNARRDDRILRERSDCPCHSTTRLRNGHESALLDMNIKLRAWFF